MALANNKHLDDASDVRKMGYLIKLKTNKKKFFVLRERSSLGPARLEYYDSERKVRTRQFKRSIDLESCFNINRKTDGTALGSTGQQQPQAAASATARAKQFAIALFTKDDCFTVGCESVAEQLDWLTKMTELRNAALDPETKALQFEHIWQVTVKPKELGNEKKVTPGEYRFCLTNNSVSLIPINEEKGFNIPMESVKRVGCSSHYVMLEFGRAAVTGPGALWLQVEDSVIAHNIHAAVMGSMRLIQPEFRVRIPTAPSKDRERPTRISQASGGAVPPSSGSKLPKRSQTIHITNQQVPAAIKSLRSEVCNTRTDRISLHDPVFDQFDGLNPAASGVRTITPEVPILEEPSYVPMDQHDPALDLQVSSDGRNLRRFSPTSHLDRHIDSSPSLTAMNPITTPSSDYLDMAVQCSGTARTSHSPQRLDNRQGEGVYLNMSPSVTQDVLCGGANSVANSWDYMSMSPAGQPGVSHVTTTSADEYMNMTPAGRALDESSAAQKPDENNSDWIFLDRPDVGATTVTTIKSSMELLSTTDSDSMRGRSGSDSYMMMSVPGRVAEAASGGARPGVVETRPGIIETRPCDAAEGVQAGGTRPSGVGRIVVDGEERDENGEYISMTAPGSEGYLSMSVRRVTDDAVGQGSSSSVSSAVSSAGSSSVNNDQQTTDVTFRSLSRLPEMTTTSGDGYIEMLSPPQEEAPLLPYERPRLATVHCYVREENDEVPYRTFSVGSKPFKPVRNLNAQHYIDMTGRKVLLNKAGRPIAVAVNSEVYKCNEKSSSAPHLSEELSSNGVARGHLPHRPPQHPALSAKSSGADNCDDRLMMLDFDRGSKDEDLGAMPRLRTSSGGSRDLRTKAFSFSGAKEAFTSFFKRSSASGHTANNRLSATGSTGKPSNKGSSRVRTESFGLSVAQPHRPRASTEGNPAQLREAGGLDARAHREAARKTSEGNDSSAAYSDDAVYMDLKPGHVKACSGYMPMSPGMAKGFGSSEISRTGVDESSFNVSSIATNVNPDYMDLSVNSAGIRDSTVDILPTEADKSRSEYMDMQPNQRKQESSSAYMDMKPSRASAEPEKAAAVTKASDNLSHLSSAKSLGQVSTIISGATSLSSSSPSSAYMSMAPDRIASNVGRGVSDSATGLAARDSNSAQAYMNLDLSSEVKASGDSQAKPSTATLHGAMEGSGSQSINQSRSQSTSQSSSLAVGDNYVTGARITYADLDLQPSQPARSSPSTTRPTVQHEYAEIDFKAAKK